MWAQAPEDIKVNLALSLIVEILKISDGGRAAFLFVKIFDISLVYLYLCYNISTVCELKERNSEVKRSYVF